MAVYNGVNPVYACMRVPKLGCTETYQACAHACSRQQPSVTFRKRRCAVQSSANPRWQPPKHRKGACVLAIKHA
eukprot:364696-Chlamydomonas_euryale.AAC.7